MMKLRFSDLQTLGLGGSQECEHFLGLLMNSGEFELIDYLTMRDLLRFGPKDDLALMALVAVMLLERNDGSLCLSLTAADLARNLFRLTDADQPGLVDAILNAIEGERWNRLIGNSPEGYVPMIRQRSKTQLFLYFQQNLHSARALRTCVEGIVSDDLALLADTATMTQVLDEVFGALPHNLNEQQRLAVCLSFLKRFVVISGGPGTGKTSVVVALLLGLLKCGVDPSSVCLAAPTGRAAQRMSESIQRSLPDLPEAEAAAAIDGHTIHHVLRYQPRDNRFKYGADLRLPYKVIIVDEVSMVDVALMANLLQALPADARIIFLGDKDQLPSVDAGAVLADLIPQDCPIAFRAETLGLVRELQGKLPLPEPGFAGELTDHVVILEQSYRSEVEILRVADAVNRHDPSVVERIPRLLLSTRGLEMTGDEHGTVFVPIGVDDSSQLEVALDSWAIENYLAAFHGKSWRRLVTECRALDFVSLPQTSAEGEALLDELFSRLTRCQILTFVRNGFLGTTGINRYMDVQLRRAFDPNAKTSVFAGAPIIIQRNDRGKQLYNGDVGIVLRDEAGGYRGVFRRTGGYVSFSVDSLPPYDLAFAITVHKSQGSEYDRVMLVLPGNPDNRLLSKEIVYTGLTRAKSFACVIGRQDILEKAISSRINRETGFSMWGELELRPTGAKVEAAEAERPADAEDVDSEEPDDLNDLPLFGWQDDC